MCFNLTGDIVRKHKLEKKTGAIHFITTLHIHSLVLQLPATIKYKQDIYLQYLHKSLFSLGLSLGTLKYWFWSRFRRS